MPLVLSTGKSKIKTPSGFEGLHGGMLLFCPPLEERVKKLLQPLLEGCYPIQGAALWCPHGLPQTVSFHVTSLGIEGDANIRQGRRQRRTVRTEEEAVRGRPGQQGLT